MAGARDEAEALTTAAREGEPERYLAALLASPTTRDGLLALAAFAAELHRIPRLVTREPAMGEIRLQWWHDALAQPAGTRSGHPVADAVRAAAAHHALPVALLHDVIEAHASELVADPFVDDGAMTTYLRQREGALFALAVHILDPSPGIEAHAAAEAAGQAYGLTRLLLGLPHALSQGRVPLPLTQLQAAGISPEAMLAGTSTDAARPLFAALRAKALDHLAVSRQHVAKLPRPLRIAFLPLALVHPYVRALERAVRHELRAATDVAPLTRVCRIAAAHWLGRA